MLRVPWPGLPMAALLVSLPVAGALVAGCAGDSDAGARRPRQAVKPLTSVPWSSFTYPSACFTTGSPQPVPVHDDKATGPDGIITMNVAPPVFGDVNGDGVADAAITYRCIGANASPDTLLVYVATAAGPRLAATLLRGQEIYVRQVRPTGDGLTVTGLGYSANAPHCCPDENVRLDYRWSGGQLVLDGEQRTPRPQS